MNRVSLGVFSYFDTGNRPSGEEPERFYHGFVLGLIVDLQGRYVITSNRESGFSRYDVMLEPKNPKEDDAIILEFKVHDPEDEATLKETVQSALAQIEEKQYAAKLVSRGISKERIRSYGVAFEGKKVQQSADIDVVAISEIDKCAVVGECKFKNEKIDKGIYDTLLRRAGSISGKYRESKYIFFSLSGYTDWFDTLKDKRAVLLSLSDLYE